MAGVGPSQINGGPWQPWGAPPKPPLPLWFLGQYEENGSGSWDPALFVWNLGPRAGAGKLTVGPRIFPIPEGLQYALITNYRAPDEQNRTKVQCVSPTTRAS